MSTRRAFLAVGVAAGLGACSRVGASAGAPQVRVEGAWVRTTEGATMPSMSAAFMTIANPGDADVSLVSATAAVAGVCEIHEMVKGADGAMVMRQAERGVVVPAGSHTHLTPGGYHVMLMQLKQPLLVGAEVALELQLSDGQRLSVSAPVKVFAEEEDHYHSPSPSPSPTRP